MNIETKKTLLMLHDSCKGYCSICPFSKTLHSEDCILVDFETLEEYMKEMYGDKQ